MTVMNYSQSAPCPPKHPTCPQPPRPAASRPPHQPPIPLFSTQRSSPTTGARSTTAMMPTTFIPSPLTLSVPARSNVPHVCRGPCHVPRTRSRPAVRRSPLGMCAGSPTNPVPRDLKPAVKELRSVLKKCPIYLVGPMGSGKSAVGKYLAYELGFRFLDTDSIIEEVAKKKVSDIFDDDGEDAFRNIESAVLAEVQQFIACCVATGGGAVLRQPNWGKMQTGIIVYLKAEVDVLVSRLQGDTTRPLLKGAEDLRGRVASILEERSSLYEQADVVVPVDQGQPIDEIGNEVVRRLTNFIKSNPPRLSKLYPGNLKKDK